jgi:hypothetical protein
MFNRNKLCTTFPNKMTLTVIISVPMKQPAGLTIECRPLLVRRIRLLFFREVRMPPRMLCWWRHGLAGWTSRIHLCARTSCGWGLLAGVNLLFHKSNHLQYCLNVCISKAGQTWQWKVKGRSLGRNTRWGHNWTTKAHSESDRFTEISILCPRRQSNWYNYSEIQSLLITVYVN